MITITMNKFSLSLLSFSLLFFTCLATSELDRFNQCQLDSINALEPDHRVECEAGLIESWNPNHPELQCAGVSLIRRTIDPNGLHLPSFSPSPQLIFIIQGKGVLGLSIPGCPETFEEPRSSSQFRQQSKHQQHQQQQQPDSHQKIRRFNKGDVIAIPAGIPYWTYNHGNEPLIAISLLDTSNTANQLDSTPRVFYLGGNPEAEFTETQEEQQQGRHQQRRSFPGRGGRRGGQHQQQEESEEQNEGNSVLSGFSSEFLAQALNMNEDAAKRLQSPRDQRSQIVRVEDGLQIISPDWQEEDEDEEERTQRQQEEEDERRQGHSRRQRRQEDEDEDERQQRHDRRQRRGEDEDEDERQPRHGRRQRREQEEDEDERQPRHGHRQRREQDEDEEERQPRHDRRQRREEEEDEKEQRSGRREHGRENGLEETICSAKFRENIARPARADLYNPRAGRITTANSLTLPILRHLRLSAEYVQLYRNGINAPHWTTNANGLMYVLRGEGRVTIVNCEGKAVFDDRVRKGQLLVVPQNFVVAQQAGEEERFEYVVFKTNDRASVSNVKQVFRATPAEVLQNALGLRQNEVSQIKSNENRSPLVNPQSQSQ